MVSLRLMGADRFRITYGAAALSALFGVILILEGAGVF